MVRTRQRDQHLFIQPVRKRELAAISRERRRAPSRGEGDERAVEAEGRVYWGASDPAGCMKSSYRQD